MTNGDHEAEDRAANAGDRLVRMEWTEEGEQSFTLIAYDYHGKVWRVELEDIWAAMVSRGGMSTASYNITTQVEAQAWCEHQFPKTPEPARRSI